MVLHHLHRSHIGGGNAGGGEVVAALQHVHVLDVELRDGLALVFHLAVVLHLDAWHLLQHIGNDNVRCVAKGIHHIVYRVVAAPNLLRLHAHFLQLQRFFHHGEIDSLCLVFHLLELPLQVEAINRNEQFGFFALRNQLIMTFLIRKGIGHRKAVRHAQQHHRGIINGLFLLVVYLAGNGRLGEGLNAEENTNYQKNKPFHINYSNSAGL